MVLNNIRKVANETRRNLESGEIDSAYLAKLYQQYNPIENVDLFVRRAKELFPNLNCGLASLCLKESLGGEIVNGKYNRENHTFLLLDKKTIVDITADQYGGPRIYVGRLKRPWSIKK